LFAVRLATQLARSQADRELLINELNHRVKNILATVQGLVASTLRSAVSIADTKKVMEERIIGRETTVGILAGEALPVVEVRPRQGVYDYSSKYTAGASDYFCPAPFEASDTERIQAAALGAFRAVGGPALVLEVSLPSIPRDNIFADRRIGNLGVL